MDPSQLDGVSLILAALAAGAAEGVKDSVKKSVVDLRDKLVQMLKSRFRNREDGAADLNVYLRRPTQDNADALAGHIREAGLDGDQSVLSIARHLMQVAGPAAFGPGSLAATNISQMNTTGASGFIGGQHSHYHESATPGPVVSWDLRRTRGSMFELINTGTAAAYDVALEAPGAVRFDPPEADLSIWPRGTGHEFFAVGSFQTGHPRLVVTWKDSPNGRQSQVWERPLPR